MKKIIVCLLSLFFISKLNAQSNHYKDSLLNSLNKNRFSLNNFNELNQKKFDFNALPKAIPTPQIANTDVIKLQQQLTYIGHSNNSNIYQSTPDKMYVIKPDSTFKSNMPVADLY